MTQTISSDAIDEAIEKLVREIAAKHKGSDNLVLAAIANGGIPISQILKKRLEAILEQPIGSGIIDISFHRDDFGSKPITKEVEMTELFHNPEETTIILVDDVLFSGRTVRAALAELQTLGRPNRVELATLVDRGNRRLPIAADYTGMVIETTEDQDVIVSVDLEHPEKSQILIK